MMAICEAAWLYLYGSHLLQDLRPIYVRRATIEDAGGSRVGSGGIVHDKVHCLIKESIKHTRKSRAR